MKLSEAVEGYVITKTGDGMSANTIKGYKDHYNQLRTYLGDVDIETITQDDIARFFAWLRRDYKPKRTNTANTDPLKTTTIRNAWCAVRSLYNWLAELPGYENFKRPDKTIKMPKVSYPEIQPLKEGEIDAILKACALTKDMNDRGKVVKRKRPTADRDTALVLFALDTGLRASEIAAVNIEDINLTTGEVFVKVTNSARKNKSRTVFVGSTARKCLWRYLQTRHNKHPTDPLFLLETGKRMDRGNIRHLFTALGERAGVKNTYPHRFRHTFAVEYLRNGGDVFTLQRLLGHTTLDMVRHYLELSSADLEAAHRHASPVDRWRLK